LCNDSKLDQLNFTFSHKGFIKVRAVLKIRNALVGWERLQATQQQPFMLPFWRKTHIWLCRDDYGIWNTVIIHSQHFDWDVRKRKVAACCITMQTAYCTNYKNCYNQLPVRSIALPTCSPNTSPPYLDLCPELKELLHGQCLQSLETMNTCMTWHIRHLNSSGQLSGTRELLDHWEAVIRHEIV
jgi:hypothetical protein